VRTRPDYPLCQGHARAAGAHFDGGVRSAIATLRSLAASAPRAAHQHACNAEQPSEQPTDAAEGGPTQAEMEAKHEAGPDGAAAEAAQGHLRTESGYSSVPDASLVPPESEPDHAMLPGAGDGADSAAPAGDAADGAAPVTAGVDGGVSSSDPVVAAAGDQVQINPPDEQAPPSEPQPADEAGNLLPPETPRTDATSAFADMEARTVEPTPRMMGADPADEEDNEPAREQAAMEQAAADAEAESPSKPPAADGDADFTADGAGDGDAAAPAVISGAAAAEVGDMHVDRDPDDEAIAMHADGSTAPREVMSPAAAAAGAGDEPKPADGEEKYAPSEEGDAAAIEMQPLGESAAVLPSVDTAAALASPAAVESSSLPTSPTAAEKKEQMESPQAKARRRAKLREMMLDMSDSEGEEEGSNEHAEALRRLKVRTAARTPSAARTGTKMARACVRVDAQVEEGDPIDIEPDPTFQPYVSSKSKRRSQETEAEQKKYLGKDKESSLRCGAVHDALQMQKKAWRANCRDCRKRRAGSLMHTRVRAARASWSCCTCCRPQARAQCAALGRLRLTVGVPLRAQARRTP
jgi:hypothetical protein